MRVEGDWARDGILVIRELYDPARTARLLDISERLLATFRRSDPMSGGPGSPTATSIFQIHRPEYFPAQGSETLEIMEAAADPGVLSLVEATCDTPDPLFSHTSIFFNPTESRDELLATAGKGGSSGCCGEWHRDAQYIKPDEEDERKLVTNSQHVVGGRMMQIQVALKSSAHFEFVRGSHNRWDTAGEYAVRKGGGANGVTDDPDDRPNKFSDAMPGAQRDRLNPGDALVFSPWVIHRGHYRVDEPRASLMFTYSAGPRPTYPGVDR